MGRLLPLLLLCLTVHVCTAQGLRINEIGYDLDVTGLEFIELINTSDDPVDLGRFMLADARGNPVPAVPGGYIVQPGEYAVLTSNRASLASRFGFAYGIEPASWPALNNSGDAVVILLDGVAVDSVAYNPSWGGEGTSLERRDPMRPSTDPENWADCNDATGATPGRRNSIYAPDRKPPRVILAEETAPGIVTVYFDEAFGPGDPEIRMDGRLPDGISVADNHTLRASFSGVGGLQVSNVADLAGNILRDTTLVVARLGLEHDVVINEIMYEPLVNSYDNRPDGIEYVELLGIRDEPVGLTGWFLTTRASESGRSDTLTISVGPAAILPGGYLVATGTVSLRNDGDELYLHRADGTVIEQVTYRPEWHNPIVRETRGIALERISGTSPSNDPGNWTSSVHPDGGTPGKANSVLVASEIQPSGVGLSVEPSPFSPDHDGMDDVTLVRYVLRELPSAIRVRIYDLGGRLVRTLAPFDLSGQEGSLVWDGFDDEEQPLPIGIYIVLLDATGTGGLQESHRATVVLARRLGNG